MKASQISETNILAVSFARRRRRRGAWKIKEECRWMLPNMFSQWRVGFFSTVPQTLTHMRRRRDTLKHESFAPFCQRRKKIKMLIKKGNLTVPRIAFCCTFLPLWLFYKKKLFSSLRYPAIATYAWAKQLGKSGSGPFLLLLLPLGPTNSSNPSSGTAPNNSLELHSPSPSPLHLTSASAPLTHVAPKDTFLNTIPNRHTLVHLQISSPYRSPAAASSLELFCHV